MTPLIRRNETVRDLKNRVIFSTPRLLPANSLLLQNGDSLHSPGKTQMSRKMSLPLIKPADSVLPRIRSRAGSDPRTTTRILREAVAKPILRPPELTVCIGKCYSSSQVGTVCSRPKPNNQDTHYYVHTTLPSTNYSILGVCDGHGQAGHFVSGFVAKQLPVKVRESYIQHAGRQMDFWSGVMIDSFTRCNNELKAQSFDTVCSGCTSVAVTISEGLAVCANVGDSRAVLARKTGSCLTALPLSRDQKPDVPEEKQRIIDYGGRVEAIMDEDGQPVGPPRVWLMNEDVPGLAMSRAMGDTLATRVGVTATPGMIYAELFTVPLTPDDSFIVLASDGIWEFMSSQEVVSQVAGFVERGRTEDCCKLLVEEATKRWQREEDCVDDITVVVAFLEAVHS